MVNEKKRDSRKMHKLDLNNNKKLSHSSDRINNNINHKSKVQSKVIFYSECDLREAKVTGQDAKIISLMIERYHTTNCIHILHKYSSCFRREREIEEMEKINYYNRKRDIEKRLHLREREESEKRRREILYYKRQREDDDLKLKILLEIEENERNSKYLEKCIKKRDFEKSIHIQNVHKQKEIERRKIDKLLKEKQIKVKENRVKLEKQLKMMAEQKEKDFKRRHERSKELANQYLDMKNDSYKR